MKKLNLQLLFKIAGFTPIFILIIMSSLFFYTNFLKYQDSTALIQKINSSNGMDLKQKDYYFNLNNPTTSLIEKLLLIRVNLNKGITNIKKQRLYLTNITKTNKPISKKMYQSLFFDLYFNNNSTALIYLAKKYTKIRILLHSKEYKLHLIKYTDLLYKTQINANIYAVTDQFNGYSIKSKQVFEIFTNRINDIKKINKVVTNEINILIKNEKDKIQQMLIISSILLFLSILLLFIYLAIERKITKNFIGLNELVDKLLPLANEANNVVFAESRSTEESYKIIDQAIEKAVELTQKAEEEAKAKSSFLANMSHEIRTPLNGILGFLELLKSTGLNEEQSEYVNTITVSSNSLLEIINNILDISKIESDKMELELIPFKPVNEFEETIEIFGARTADKGIGLVADIDPSIPISLKGDILKIKEVITNLLSNAIKFTHDGYIYLKIKKTGSSDNKVKILFEVQDSGIGISEEQKDKIFQAFSQADISVTRRYGGTGLGLAISGRYIELMGDSIRVESELNKGTKFFFEIELDVLDNKESLAQNSFNKVKLAVLSTKNDDVKFNVLKDYLVYSKAEIIYFENIDELKEIVKNHSLNAVTIVYELLKNKELIKYLESINLKYTLISSLKYKKQIDKLAYKPIYTIWDPINPHKTFLMLEEIENSKLNSYKKIIETINRKENDDKFDLKVLVAEDNPINQKLIKITLEQMDISVVLANNGLEAFNKYNIKPNDYDLIFMDIQMPIMDGVQATHDILDFEDDEEIPHTPIIALTANALTGDREKFLAEGMDEYLTKPINKEALINIIKKFAKDKMKQQLLNQNDDELNNEELPISTSVNIAQNIIIARTNLLDKTIITNYLTSFGFNKIHSISAIKELGTKIDKQSNNVLFIDEDFVEGFKIEKVAGMIKVQVPDIKIIVFSDKNNSLQNVDYVLDNVTKQNLIEIL